MIFILILIVIIILVFLVYISLSSSFKIIKIEESNNKLNLEIVNYFGTRYNWTLSKGSDYGQRVIREYIKVGNKINKFSLHGNYKGFTKLPSDKNLWKEK